MLDPLGPAHVGDVDQAIDARLHLDESAERGEVTDLTADPRTGRVLLGQGQPGVLLGLLHPEGDLFFFGINPQNHRLDPFADADQLRRVPDVAGPAHLGDVHEPLDTALQLDEGAVVGDRDHLALDANADGVLFFDALPGVGLELLEAE